ncbi:uncharacterized protein [Physcomitrium patens]|uniref:SMP-LTD domain-containing protein n=1 Tax=Physcomitrium patens TaxID=3218 RepID=A0A2K1KFL5_PHYPA|nr:uncharacterized protein LOC112284022 isoform X1 [Physcomitrium patens]PNR52553.1 hypothetical protein PHYPA_008927 [Physcomitrium patens]|eukprot:XP_024379254.1 uncharacterized protein LOC112284022 isoform X1 [Physcomitrella patens]
MMNPSNTMCPALAAPNCSTFTCLRYFFAGVVGLGLVELVLALYLLNKVWIVNCRPRLPVSSESILNIDCEDGSISLQGNAWIAPFPDGDLSKLVIKYPRKYKKNKDGQRVGSRVDGTLGDVLEIAPMWRRASLKNKVLFLKAVDGTTEEVSLEGCEVLSVSSSPGPNRKWGKKFPIKLHHPSRDIYRGCKQFLFYLESGFAKETWCQGFRAVASQGISDWTLLMKRRYKEYTRVAEGNMPYLTKFYSGGEDRLVNFKQEEAERRKKRRIIWNMLARRVSIGNGHKRSKFVIAVDEIQRGTEPLSQQHDDKNRKKKDTDLHEGRSATNPSFSETAKVNDSNHVHDYRCTLPEKLPICEPDVNAGEGNNPASGCTQSDDLDEVSATYRKFQKSRGGKEIEQGVLCLNMIIARLYFDFNQSIERLASVDRFFQNLIMKIKIPSYIKSIDVKEFDLGKKPPFATAIRILPADAEGTIAMELDVEWHGGGYLTCETRLDLREQSAQENVAVQLSGSRSEGDAAAAVLSGIRGDFGLTGSSDLSAAVQKATECNLSNSSETGDEGSSRNGGLRRPFKSVMSRVADHVSQVPITLKIRLVSLKGTIVLRLKAPPSDRVWFAFKEEPEINFAPEPCIGERRISSTTLGAYVGKLIKARIRESVVMPFCESFHLDWMVADKDNWLPQSQFPLSFFVAKSWEAERQASKQELETSHSPLRDVACSPDHQSLSGSQSSDSGRNKPPKAQPLCFRSRSRSQSELHRDSSRLRKTASS